ncbi:fructofuranosidase/invertase [Belliella sp. R4-6]|uniref:beta-fructofuranosidase n=1 Tax=Belliella alkalica TaxID=1730871 RepID=A0ABS9VBP9_9BACT|nr:glycoside hydrolase 100 family protein [Belliella alkalica]MCH7413854.1 fructofuranosidase/invertase [Belliella alkalica]
MDIQIANEKALEVVRKSSHKKGFLASALKKDNYQRVWARDGVITGIAALASREEDLIATFRDTLITLGDAISPQGHIPSNVELTTDEVSFGGLAGRADTGSWWIIGLCLYSKYTGDKMLLNRYKKNIDRIHQLYQAWEYNNKDLIYVPLAGDWADEYILSGYVLYDQVLRYAALKLSGDLLQNQQWSDKAEFVKLAIHQNFDISDKWKHAGIHPTAKNNLLRNFSKKSYLPASFNPAGYQDYFDGLGNALAMIFKIHPNPQACLSWATDRNTPLIPAFYPTIDSDNPDFNLLKQNYRFEFRNIPHEFHNGGVWPMVNGFWGVANYISAGKKPAEEILNAIIALNSKDNWGFNECFHGQTLSPCGVHACTWSAAGQLILSNTISKGFYLLD